MNKLYLLISLLFCFFTISCKKQISYDKKSNLIIEDFKLNHYKGNGKKLYKLETPYSTFNKVEQSYSLDKTKIYFYEMDVIKYIINSDSAKLFDNKLIELKGNVEVTDTNDNNNNKVIIKSNNLFWNIEKYEFILEGNVTLVNNKIRLNSSKAILDKKKDIINFFKPVKYNYKDKNNITKYDIKSEDAFYNLSNQNVIFKSESNKVKSRIIF